MDTVLKTTELTKVFSGKKAVGPRFHDREPR